jgi:hypothetical protein
MGGRTSATATKGHVNFYDLKMKMSCLRKPTVFETFEKEVPLTELFPSYMVPLPLAVKAEIVKRGSGKRDYRHRARIGCVDKR